MRTLKKIFSGECSDHTTPAAYSISDSLVLRAMLSYLAARAGSFPRGLIKDTDLGALKNFISQHPSLSERCGVMEDEMDVLRKAVEGA